MSKIIMEGLAHLDMENQIIPILDIDKYESKIGEDDDIITATFTVRQQAVGDDLVDWLERGYEWVIDAETSPGEVNPGKYLVFIEMNRRSSSPRRIIEMLSDLEVLTGLSIDDWKLRINDEQYPATEEEIKKHVTTSPLEYRNEHESELNEWREIAGVSTVSTYTQKDDALQQIQRQAGIL